MLVRLASLLLGYAFGSFLTADVVARVLAGTSAFETGDGNPGMANIGAHLGVPAAAAVLAGDILKTVLAFVLVRALFAQEAAVAGVWAGLGATLGHNYPFWHGFRGGKGVTTTCSAIILASPVAGFVSCVVGLATVIIAGYLCLGALAITLVYALAMAALGTTDQLVCALVLLVLMLLAHGGSALRIRRGETPRASLSDAFWARVHHKRE